MKRQLIIMLSLLATLTAFVAGSWGGLRQWWQSLTFRRQTIYVGLLFCAVAGIIGHLLQVNPLMVLAGLIFCRLVVYLIQLFVWIK